MNKFVYRSIIVLPSGKLMVKFTENPNIAETLGGVLTCRSRPGTPRMFERFEHARTRSHQTECQEMSLISHPFIHPT